MNKLEVKDKLKDNKLPEGWIKVKLGELCKVIPGQAPLSKFYNKEGKGYPFIKVNNFTNKYPIIDTWTTFSLKESKDTDILLSVAGSVGFVNYGINASITRSVFAIRPNQKSVQIFLFYLLKKYSNYFENLGSGSAQKIITIKSVEELKILFPSSLPEQHKIVEILETVDETIEKTDAIIEKYKRIKQGLMQDLLTTGITAFEFEKDKLIAAVKKVFDSGDHSFGREENLVSHLSRHLNEFFPGWNVDSEVEKNNDRQRPDMIIHKRRTDENLFAIEVKKNENINAIKKDVEKLEDVMLGDYHYEDVVFIGFYIENFEDVFKLSEKVNFILVSKNGEIKIKSRVRRFKESPLGRIPEEWEVVALGEVCRFINGRAFKPSEWSKSGLPIIRIENLNNMNAPYNYCNFKVDKKYWILEGDLLLSWSGTPGTSFGMFIWNRGEAILNQHIFRVIIEKLLDKKYLYYKFNSMLDEMISQSHGSAGLKHVTKSYLDKIKLAISISLSEQHRIASVLSQIDDTIEKEKKYKEKSERIKQGLMEDLLTGKVKVLNVN